ncbi:hypothetical protein GSI_05646 [Ganoderma sinense ZZ0214-1]|uniref:Uncharacterized protein n=1 Tax=Ganoderma sinense ZZ0214-1 TaxID=1077348 RepID=A0A2G8SF58_9APHY|nr:hypothetical protein GSI_05646 [Ganoderma sinense ZZ0214-1]
MPPEPTRPPPPENRGWVRRIPTSTGRDSAQLRQTAAILRHELPQPGLGLWLLRRETLGATWRLFRQVRIDRQDLNGAQQPEFGEEYDPACGQGIPVHGLD